MVAPLPTSGARPMMSDARDARTCCDPSLHSSATAGRIWLTTSSGASMREKAASLTAAAVRTSASGSYSGVHALPRPEDLGWISAGSRLDLGWSSDLGAPAAA